MVFLLYLQGKAESQAKKNPAQRLGSFAYCFFVSANAGSADVLCERLGNMESESKLSI